MSFQFPTLPGAFPADAPPAFPEFPGAPGGPGAPAPGGPPRSFVPGHLPNGTPLLLTLSAKRVYRLHAEHPDADGPQTLSDALLLLLLCAHTPDTWNQPRTPDGGGRLLPALADDRGALFGFLDAWVDATFRLTEEAELFALARHTWDDAHATLTVPTAKKKTVLHQPPSFPPSTISSSGSSPEATSPDSPPSATAPP